MASATLADGALVELVYDPKRHNTALAVWREGTAALEQRILDGGRYLVPFSAGNNLIKNEVVLLPSEPIDYESSERLLVEIRAFLHRYVDLTPTFETIATAYVVLSWLYDAFNELPYLRLRGDYGTGKTRALLAIGSICYKPVFASGAATVSPLFHTLDAFRGTLIYDEADFRFSDERAEIVKILNNGNVRGLPVLRTMVNKDREFNPRAFQVFGPKILATRQTYQDRGLESRFITEDMGSRPLRADIPINLTDEFKEEAQVLRDKLLLYRFKHLSRTRLDHSLRDTRLEPRLNQILIPLLSVVADPRLRHDLRAMAMEAQAGLVAERGLQVEAQVLEVLAELMASSNRSVVPLADITSALTERYGTEYERTPTNRFVGGVLRRRLHVRTYKSHGTYVVPMVERPRVELLCTKYGATPPSLFPSRVQSGDVGTSGTDSQPLEPE